MTRLLWLADCLRDAGLTVHEVDGWRTRGLESYGPVYGVTIHETRGSASSTDAGEISVLLNGSTTAPPPISQLYLSRSGAWHVVASGTCYHNLDGWGGPNQGLGNDSLLGIEAQHSADEDWASKPVQYQSYVRGVAALCARGGWPVNRVAGHKEHQPGDKPDPEFDMNRFRSDVAAAMAGVDDMLEYGDYGQSKGTAGRPQGVLLDDIWGALMLGKSPYDNQRYGLLKDLDRIEAAVKGLAAALNTDAIRAALRDALKDALGQEAVLTPDQVEAASERALRRVLGQLDATPPAA